MRHLFQRKKTVCRTDRRGEKPAFGGYASKVCEQLDRLGSKRFQRYMNLHKYDELRCNTPLKH